MIIAVDAMGGDYGPDVTVPATIQIIEKNPDLQIILVGDQEILQKKIAGYFAQNRLKNSEEIKSKITIHHASEKVEMDESPTKVLRNKKDSSMRVAINLVKNGTANACVSAGNTGALMATAHFVLKTIPGVDRSAIESTFPTINPQKHVRMLDLGANVDSTANHLYQFAIMGSLVASNLDNIAHPKIGLLNVGEEEIKGNEQVKQTAVLLSQNKKINYIGYVEGDDIFKGDVDVVVCDGFIGNVALKTIEGLAKLIVTSLKRNFSRNIFTKLSALIAMPVLKKLSKEFDPGRYNGASFLGLQGIVIKSHGGANIPAFANAIKEATLQVKNNVPQKIRDEVSKMLQEPIAQ